MRVEPEDPEQPPESGEVAVDDPLEVRHPAAAPVLELLASQEPHPDEHIDRRHDVPGAQESVHRTRDAGVQRVVAIARDGWRSRRHGGRVPRVMLREQPESTPKGDSESLAA